MNDGDVVLLKLLRPQLIYASNEPKSVLARDLGDCRDNLRNSRSVFLIVYFVLYVSCFTSGIAINTGYSTKEIISPPTP